MRIHPIFSTLCNGLIVSCQALEDEPLYGAEHMAAMARAAVMGGALGIRANSPIDIAAIRALVHLPLIGLYKQTIPGFEVYITPTIEAALQVSQAGADIIAMDATLRLHPGGKSSADLIAEIKTVTGKPILADIDTFDAGLAAVASGADAVSTTMSGHTAASMRPEGPDFDLLARLVARLDIPVIAEGSFWTPDEALRALQLGAYAVVIGAAITRPQLITRRFVTEIMRFYSTEAK
ncbi:MAG: N-acetylmannosamine-6-phosphate 2-epimerase [Chloroflexota bacterium]